MFASLIAPQLNLNSEMGARHHISSIWGWGMVSSSPSIGKGEPCHPYRPPLSQEASRGGKYERCAADFCSLRAGWAGRYICSPAHGVWPSSTAQPQARRPPASSLGLPCTQTHWVSRVQSGREHSQCASGLLASGAPSPGAHQGTAGAVSVSPREDPTSFGVRKVEGRALHSKR